MTAPSRLLLPLLLVTATAWAADPPAAIVLFDGKSLDGWKAVEARTPGEVVVADGAIVLGAGSPFTGITTTRTDLPTVDYELRYEAKRLKGRDFFAAATFPVGPGFVTLVNGGWGGSVTGLSSINGADASENETNKFVKYQDDTWYRFRIRVTARVIRASIDDKELFAVDHDGLQLKTRVEVRGNQPLGFATWRTSGAVRAVAIRPLTAAEVAEVNRID